MKDKALNHLKFLKGRYPDIDLQVFGYLEELLTSKQITDDDIIKELTPHYKDWYARFDKIEIDDTGVYAVCNKGEYDHQRFIIFKVIDELFETHTCSHLKLEHIDLITTFFMQEVK